MSAPTTPFRTGSPARRHHAGHRRIVERLAAAGIASPEADARRLSEHAAALAAHHHPDGVQRARAAILDGLVARRVERIPLQQIVGATWFRHLRVACRPGVFVPRPETEVVAGLAIDAAREQDAPVVVEPCTGTGAVALSVAAEVPRATVVAGDVSRRAVALARHNLAALELGRAGPDGLAGGAGCRIVRSNLLGGIDPALRGQVDVLVANPPYLPAADRPTWPAEVADHDPPRALIGGDDGLEVVVGLLVAAGHWLAPGGTAVIEIDERRGPAVTAAARRAGLTDVRLARDLTGADRAVVARRPSGRPRPVGRPEPGERS